MSSNFFLKVSAFLLITSSLLAGEPGTEVEKSDQKVEKSETINTKINLPKNPIDKIFLQPLRKKIDTRAAIIIGDCLPQSKEGKCKIVKPKKKSSHFNRYYYYLNSNNEVYAVIAFANKRVGTTDYCRSLIKEWGLYFNNYDLIRASEEANLDQIILTKDHINKTEVYMSCFPESYRDIKSYFALKLIVHEN